MGVLLPALLVWGALEQVAGMGVRAQERSQPSSAPRTSAPIAPDSAPVTGKPAALTVAAPSSDVITFTNIDQVRLVPPAPSQFHFNIAENTPAKDLLPVPPPARKNVGPMLGNDLSRVPEVEFQMPLAKDLPRAEALKQTAHMLAKINHVNRKATDAFPQALVSARQDLVGLPLAMGDACRTKGERSRQFAQEVALVRGALQQRAAGQAVNFLQATNVVLSIANPPPPAPPLPVNGAVPNGAPAPQPVQPANAVLPLARSQSDSHAPPSAPRPAPEPAPQPAPPTANANPRPPDVFPPPPLAVPVMQSVVMQGTSAERGSPDKFWERYQTACAQKDKTLSQADKATLETVTLARIAALMQVLAPEPAGFRVGLVKFLSTIAHAEATRALARLAIFSGEDDVRQAALGALKVRREKDYTDILLQGMRYPWPEVARHAADALIHLERTDLVPQLVDLLDEPDPRAPVLKEMKDQQVPTVRELVRINHHRNCALCHSPANTGNVAAETLTAAIPLPCDPLQSFQDGYQDSVPDVKVRIDVTYLRQDFSAYQAVTDANPWPEMQRFDFLVRNRVLSEKEAEAFREKLALREPGRLSPYHRAALAALRELTGRDTAPTAEAWRQLLDLPEKQKRTALAR
ncbi:MAG TPA: HEAT repeat domain-containing protein [Gemmataceae bacterium]|nr:HEAT repeat domain-containing protein [Gemmataceae bacterium]